MGKEKKEIGKLLELLNEYEISKSHRDYEWKIEKHTKERMCGEEYTGAYIDTEEMERIIISKKYGFIEWLVREDKIDRKKLEIRPFSDGLVYSDSDCTVRRSDTTYEMLLMLLAIQDEPIRFLCSILK